MSDRQAILAFCAGAILSGLIVWHFASELSYSGSWFEPWVLPDFYFQANDDSAFVEGTMMGNDAFPDNTWVIRCVKTDNHCTVAHVEEIATRQLGDLDLADWQIVSWTPAAIVIQNVVGPTTSCSRDTITMHRQTKLIEFLEVPENAGDNFCKQGRKLLGGQQVLDWRLGNPKQPWERH